jgi:hypothetical protein
MFSKFFSLADIRQQVLQYLSPRERIQALINLRRTSKEKNIAVEDPDLWMQLGVANYEDFMARMLPMEPWLQEYVMQGVLPVKSAEMLQLHGYERTNKIFSPEQKKEMMKILSVDDGYYDWGSINDLMQKDALAVILFEGLVTPEAFCKRLIEPVKDNNCLLEIFYVERNHFNSNYFNLASAIREKLFTLDDLNDVPSKFLKNVIDRIFSIEAAKMLALPNEERVDKIFSAAEKREITAFLEKENQDQGPEVWVANNLVAIALFDKLVTWEKIGNKENRDYFDDDSDLSISSALREGLLTSEQLYTLEKVYAYMFANKAISLETADMLTVFGAQSGAQKYYDQLMASEPWKAVSSSVDNCFRQLRDFTMLALPFFTENILSPQDFTRPEINNFFKAAGCLDTSKSSINLIVMLKEKRISPWQVAEICNQKKGTIIIKIMFDPETSLGQGLRDNMLDPKLLNFAKYPNILRFLVNETRDARQMNLIRSLLIILHEKLIAPEELEKLSPEIYTLASDNGVIALRNNLITLDGIKNNPDELQDLDKKVKAYREDCLNVLSSEYKPVLK